MTADEVALLMRVVTILARMPREFAQSTAAILLWKASSLPAHDAAAELLRAGPRALAAQLAAGAFTLRGTGHFADGEALDQFASILLSWERRTRERPPRRRSTEGN